MIADTNPRSASEGQVGEGRAQLLAPFDEASGIEALWILPVAWRVVRTIDVDDDSRSCGNSDVPDAVVRNGHAVNHPKRRVEAQAFLNDLRGEFEPGKVCVTQWRVAQYGIELLPHFFETIRSGT